MDLRALSPPNNTVPEQQLNSLMRSDQARLFMNALILLRYLTCVFSHSSLARRECAEIIDYTYENCREQRFTGVLAPMNSDSHNQRCLSQQGKVSVNIRPMLHTLLGLVFHFWASGMWKEAWVNISFHNCVFPAHHFFTHVQFFFNAQVKLFGYHIVHMFLHFSSKENMYKTDSQVFVSIRKPYYWS